MVVSKEQIVIKIEKKYLHGRKQGADIFLPQKNYMSRKKY
jgi:hypothetical protein